MRQRIAQRAAQLMAEHGIRDRALAKRKAARQLGLDAAHVLPDNDAIDAALIEYHALFAPEFGARELYALRAAALAAMRMLARFEPVLCGSLVSGAITRHSDIELEIYTDSSKALEQFLLNQGIPFAIEERPEYSCFILAAELADIRLKVLPEHARAKARANRRLNIVQLERLLAAQAADPNAPT